MRGFIADMLLHLRFGPDSGWLARLVRFLSAGMVGYLTVWRFEYRFNRRLASLVSRICDHRETYDDHYWSGGRRKCSRCSKTLKVLWLPQRVVPVDAHSHRKDDSE
jgi:hypothetical protein